MATDEKPKKRVVIADDDPVSRRMLEAFLTKWDYEVITAADGLEALRILQTADAPRLAVLDWMMPGMEGPQVCQRMREHPDWPYVYILLLTARNEKTDLLKGLECGADDYLTKPFDSQELRGRLQVGQRILDLQQSLVEAQGELLFRATHDLLTGISNRGVALDALNREYSRQKRDGGSFGIILLDLDHFKYVNDTRGHPCGDAVLKEASRRIAEGIRPYDTAGRYGGEEFLVIVPMSGELGTLALAERIRASIESRPIETETGPVPVTVSSGVAISPGDSPVEPGTLIRMADDALYRAKDRGRNRCEMAIQPAPVSVPSR
jgi:two-component system, cell cycle response regulator